MTVAAGPLESVAIAGRELRVSDSPHRAFRRIVGREERNFSARVFYAGRGAGDSGADHDRPVERGGDSRAAGVPVTVQVVRPALQGPQTQVN